MRRPKCFNWATALLSSRPLTSLASLFTVAALSVAAAQAGGPTQVLAPGTYATWAQGRVNFVIDNGPLRESGGVRFSRDQGATLVREVLKAWQDVPDSFVQFEDRGFLSVDVTTANFMDFNQSGTPEGNPIIFDADGSIIDSIFGTGQNQVVLGFAFATFIDGDDFYDRGLAVLNGLRADTSLDGDFAKVTLHELGHLIGLDHTQAGLDEAFQVNGSPNVPIMFPILIRSSSPATPRADDSAWISYLYPESTFATNFGAIRGRVTRRDGGPFLGANVVATPVIEQVGEIPTLANRGFVSVVSDFLSTFDGVYELPGLPPGDYALFIEPLFADFTGGSGVGPYDFRYDNFPRDFYNALQESGDPSVDDPSQITFVHVNAGRTVEGIDFVSNESANDLASLTDDDTELFLFPEGFRFPFFGKVYSQAEVNSDGNITFGMGDGSSDPRSENRFLSGSPRIAGLFTDLNVEQGGSITSEFDGDSLTFRWDGVPEFAVGPVPNQRNTFSITLFKSGNILLHYDSFAATPDVGDPTTAIIGVSPGGLFQRGPQTDLSAIAQPIRLAATPIYQVFGPSTFDLTGADILFQAADSQLFLFFPLNESDPDGFTGFAVTNYDVDATILSIEALAPDGQSEPYPDNPHLEGLGGQEQLARLGSDFFNLPVGTSQQGWVRIGSTGTALASFFQFGGEVNGIVNRLDGSTAIVERSSTLYFTRIYDGPGSFPATGGARAAETIIAIANPNEESITIVLTLVDSQGRAVGSPVTREILPNGSLRETVSELFRQGVVSSGFVRVSASGAGAVGFELVRLSDALLGFNAVATNESTHAYSAQLASGLASSGTIFTNVKLVNSSSNLRTVTLQAVAEDGSPLAATVEVTLRPGQTLQEDAGVLFGFGSPTTAPAVSGSLRVESSGPGVIGDIVFGDPIDIHFAAALPLQTRLFRRAIFSQVANVNSSTPKGSTFTGLALYNPGAATAQIFVRVFGANGSPTGIHPIALPGGGRVSGTLEDLVPASAGQTGGYVLMDSSQPIVAQQLFGNLTLDFLSAVPPTILD